MRKLLGITLGLLVCVALAMPAIADVSVDVTVEKSKEINIWEEVWIGKYACIDVKVELESKSAAEANAMLNQVNTENAYTGVIVINPDDPSSEISNSIRQNSGIVGVNQASGTMNNQGNVVATATTTGLSAFVNSQAATEQENELNVELQLLAVSAGRIDGSISGNDGVVGVNQASGSLNNQANTVAVAAGLGGGHVVALAEADLGQTNSLLSVTDIAAVRVASISGGSITGNSGIVGVNQSSGAVNNQANIVSVSFAE
ncbi:MAG: hypothetical protein GTN74_13230 [Proteobacteria bacterium]|nr:hypothetical protein [Pseudomonadota bacterium]NIS71374.1 hypothetical protein [Pseudomonadota bacterium]